jgi:hypothetical protein
LGIPLSSSGPLKIGSGLALSALKGADGWALEKVIASGLPPSIAHSSGNLVCASARVLKAIFSSWENTRLADNSKAAAIMAERIGIG